jgi:hypothetical protein
MSLFVTPGSFRSLYDPLAFGSPNVISPDSGSFGLSVSPVTSSTV